MSYKQLDNVIQEIINENNGLWAVTIESKILESYGTDNINISSRKIAQRIVKKGIKCKKEMVGGKLQYFPL